MKRVSNICHPQRIESFLAERLSEAEEAALMEHLSTCLSCRDTLQDAAADPAIWQSASRFLPDQDFDSIALSSCEHPLRESQGDGTCELESSVPERDPQIKSVLQLLAPTDDPRMLGRLGGYEVSGIIGCGGMGVVLRGHDVALDRTIAMKVLSPHLASSGAARQRFAREAKAAAAVLHPNVIAIHSVSNSGELPYLVMPYVRGRSLQSRLDQEGQLELKEILRVGRQVAAGLAAAHAQGLVHRDIKPANILLEDGVERVTITDFGLARTVDDATLTQSGVIAGTPQYMSPEQASGQPIDARSDLFSLGSVLYAMSTGRPPFRAETTFGVLRRITDDEPRPIREINPDIPDWLCRMVQRLHCKPPAERIQSANEVEQLLQLCLAHVEQPDQSPIPESLLAKVRHSKQRRNVQRAALALLACAALAIGFMFWRTPHRESSDTEVGPLLITPNESEPIVAGGALPESPAVWNDGVEEELAEIQSEVNLLDESIGAANEK